MPRPMRPRRTAAVLLALAALAAPVGASALDTPPAPERPGSDPPGNPLGNPLRAIRLESLSATRARPLFTASRRAPDSETVEAEPETTPSPPPPPSAPVSAQLRLTLVGTVVGGTEAFALLLDPAGSAPLRLRAGERHDGWTLDAVSTREAVFSNGADTVTLRLPERQAGMGQPAMGHEGTAAPPPPGAGPAAHAPHAGAPPATAAVHTPELTGNGTQVIVPRRPPAGPLASYPDH